MHSFKGLLGGSYRQFTYTNQTQHTVTRYRTLLLNRLTKQFKALSPPIIVTCRPTPQFGNIWSDTQRRAFHYIQPETPLATEHRYVTLGRRHLWSLYVAYLTFRIVSIA